MEIRAWFHDGGKHNVALVCGQVSDALTVLDFDDLGVYKHFFNLSKLESGTMVIKTGGGKRHVYLKASRPVASFRIPELKLEVRSNGNIVIAPPSIHPNGNRYEFVNSEVRKIAVVKDLEQVWEIAGAKFGVREPGFSSRELGESRKNWKFEKPYRGKHPPCIKKLLQGVVEGFRNEAALRLAGYFLNTRKADSKKVWKKLQEWNKKNSKPLPNRELGSVLKSSSRRGYTFGCHGLQAFCDRENCPFVKVEKKRFEEEVAAL